MSMGTILLWMLGILLGIVLLCAVVIFLERKFPGREYDERQKIMRGKAADLSLMTGLVYFLVVMMILVRQVEEEKTAEPFLLIFFGLELQMLVYHTYCLLTHSAMPLSEKPVTAIVCYSVSGLIQLVFIFNRLDDFPIAMVGYGSSGWIHLTTGVFFLYLALMHLIALLHKEKE